MSVSTYQIVENGDSAITIIFDEPVSEILSTKIIQIADYLRIQFGNEFDNIIPAYQSLTISYQPHLFLKKNITDIIQLIFAKELPPLNDESKLIEIPVCYDLEYAPDITHIANHAGISVSEVIDLHTQPTYLVHMLGFLPGFLYLGGLNPTLACSRKSTPTLEIAAGSVAIGGNQTGVYPVASPGGWHVIGCTPSQLFSPNQRQHYLANPLDKIKFKSISKSDYIDLMNMEN